jgi:preprotein translocase subunit SecE
VAKQDEVEPTDGSVAAEPSDATDELTADELGDDGTVNDLDELDDLDALEAAEEGDELEDPDVEDLDDAEPVDEFDEIVRNSGVGESDEEPPAGETGQTDTDVLQSAGVAATTAGARAGSRGRAPARTPKTAATAKRAQPVKRERTTPLKFVRQSIGELRKVVYPTGQQLINYFIVVLVFVLFVIAYVSLLDLGLGAAIFRIFS